VQPSPEAREIEEDTEQEATKIVDNHAQKSKKASRDKRNKKAVSPPRAIPAVGQSVVTAAPASIPAPITTAPPAQLHSETAWSASGRGRVRANRKNQPTEGEQDKTATQQTDSVTVHKVTSPFSLTPPELCEGYVADCSPTNTKPPTPPVPSQTLPAAPAEVPMTLEVWVKVKNCRSRDPKDYIKLYNAVMAATQPYWNDPVRYNSY
jgi:hypothetical protein